jgi:colicin import membrane protein
MEGDESALITELDKYKGLIQNSIRRNWRLEPEQINKNLSCKVKINLDKGGNVLSVTILKSSGDVKLDQSALIAVNKASPLLVPTDERLFKQFETFNLTLIPGGVSYE